MSLLGEQAEQMAPNFWNLEHEMGPSEESQIFHLRPISWPIRVADGKHHPPCHPQIYAVREIIPRIRSWVQPPALYRQGEEQAKVFRMVAFRVSSFVPSFLQSYGLCYFDAVFDAFFDSSRSRAFGTDDF